jgi:hypothetical protein
MKVIDLMLYLCYRTFMRNNKEDDLGAFAISSFWVSLFLIICVYIFVLAIHLISRYDYYKFITSELYYVGLVLIFISIYYYFKKRKDTIINRFSVIGEKKEKQYFYFLIVIFNFALLTGIYLSYLRNYIFG